MVQRTVEVHPAAQNEYLCVATFLPVRSWTNVIPFLRMSSRVQEQLSRSRGVVRYGVKTDIPRKRFWTLSVWADKKLMREFVTTEPHLTAMKKFESWAGEGGASFAEYSSTTGEIDWEEAERQLRNPTFHFVPKKS